MQKKTTFNLLWAKQDLTGLTILAIENDIAKNANFDDVINFFAVLKARKVDLYCYCENRQLYLRCPLIKNRDQDVWFAALWIFYWKSIKHLDVNIVLG